MWGKRMLIEAAWHDRRWPTVLRDRVREPEVEIP